MTFFMIIVEIGWKSRGKSLDLWWYSKYLSTERTSYVGFYRWLAGRLDKTPCVFCLFPARFCLFYHPHHPPLVPQRHTLLLVLSIRTITSVSAMGLKKEPYGQQPTLATLSVRQVTARVFHEFSPKYQLFFLFFFQNSIKIILWYFELNLN